MAGPFVDPPQQSNKGFDFNSFMDFMLVLSPILEAQNPGLGMGMVEGVRGFRQQQAIKHRQDAVALLDLFRDVADEQLETTIGAVLDTGIYRDPKLVRSMAKISRGLRQPKSALAQQMEALLEDPEFAQAVGFSKTFGTPIESSLSPTAVRRLGGQFPGFPLEVQTEQVTTGITRPEIVPERQLTGLDLFRAGERGEALLPGGARPAIRGEPQPVFEQREHIVRRGQIPEPTLAEIGIPVPPWLARLTLTQARQIPGLDIDRYVPQAAPGESPENRRSRLESELRFLSESGAPGVAPRIRQVAAAIGISPEPYLAVLQQRIRQKAAPSEEDRVRERQLEARQLEAEATLEASQEEKRFLLANVPPKMIADPADPSVQKPNPEFVEWRKQLADADRRIRQSRSTINALGRRGGPGMVQPPKPGGQSLGDEAVNRLRSLPHSEQVRWLKQGRFYALLSPQDQAIVRRGLRLTEAEVRELLR